MNFIEFVSMVLQKAQSITKLSIKCHRHGFQSVYLNTWVNTAIARNVQVFYLSLSQEGLDFNMPFQFRLTNTLYTCETLEVLKLQGPIVIQIPNAICLAKLTTLELDSVVFGSGDSIDKLVSACPGLQSLKVTRYHYHDWLRASCISSSALKRLELHLHSVRDCAREMRIYEFKVKIDAPALERLVLYDDMVTEFSIKGVLTSMNEVELDLRNGESMIVDLAEAVNSATHLTLSKRSMNAISEAPNQLSMSFERLTKLVVEFDATQWSCLLDLIDRCIKLEVLDIRKVDQPRGKAAWTDASSIVPRCFLRSLKRVLLRGLDGVEDEMTVLKFILNHSSVVERVALWYENSIPITEERRMDIINLVSQLFKASPTCEISYCGGCWDGAENSKSTGEGTTTDSDRTRFV